MLGLKSENLSLSQDWALILHHHLRDGVFPSNVRAGFSQRTDRYSVLSRINDDFKINESFEFILYYPDIDEFCQWKQSVNPLRAQPKSEIDFEPINCPFKDYKDVTFKGLRLSPYSYCLLDGINEDGRWHYAVGVLDLDPNYEGIPGPKWNYKNTTLKEQYLYMRVTDPLLLPYLYSICTPFGYSRMNSRLYYSAVLITLHYSSYP